MLPDTKTYQARKLSAMVMRDTIYAGKGYPLQGEWLLYAENGRALKGRERTTKGQKGTFRALKGL